jgi:hypothetical protein
VFLATAHRHVERVRWSVCSGRKRDPRSPVFRSSVCVPQRDDAVAQHATIIDSLHETIEKQLRKLEGLHQQLARLLRKLYGPQKERIDLD